MQRGSKSMLKAPQQRKYLYIRIKKKIVKESEVKNKLMTVTF